MTPSARYVLAVLTVVASATAAVAQGGGPPANPQSEVGFDQRLDAQVPLELPFRDETGKAVRLGDYFGDKPVLLTLVYYTCPGMCTEVLNGVVDSLKRVSFEPGKDFEIVTVSFDPRDTPDVAALKKANYVQQYGRDGAKEGWHFLTGNHESIGRLTNAVGFRYAYDERAGQFAHATGIMLLTPKGRVSRYFYGVVYAPQDVRLGLVEASQNKIGNPVDYVLLMCYHYDPLSGKYSLVVMNVVRLAGAVTVLVVGSFVGLMLLREHRRKTAGDSNPVAQASP